MALTLLLMAGCASASQPDSTDPTTTTDAPTSPTDTSGEIEQSGDGPISVTFILDGGCQMMGPNCPTYRLEADGSYALSRTGTDEIVLDGTIDPAEVDELWTVITTTDIDDLVAQLGPGTSQAAFDGIDQIMQIDFADGETVTLDSTVVEFDTTLAFFEVASAVLQSLSMDGGLPIISR